MNVKRRGSGSNSDDDEDDEKEVTESTDIQDSKKSGGDIIPLEFPYYWFMPLVCTRVINRAIHLFYCNRVNALRGAELLAMQTITILRIYEGSREVGVAFSGGLN